MPPCRLLAYLFGLILLPAAPAVAETWPEQKCAIFIEAWGASAPSEGPLAPSNDFRRDIERFIADDCETTDKACPLSKADYAIADTLALIVALEGMTTSFLPFSCTHSRYAPPEPRQSFMPK